MRITAVEKNIISLVKCALEGCTVSVSMDENDWRQVLITGWEQKLSPLICTAISKLGLKVPTEFQEKIDKAMLSYFAIDQKQQLELKKMQNAFEENGIDYMPVKGVLLKPLYPSTDFRPMGDADILIRVGQKKKAFEVMEKLGYEHVQDSAHEFIFAKRGMNVELHKCLVPPYNKDYYAYFGDGWKFANKTGETTRYELSDNDHFVYMFTHFAKHYRDGGISALHIVDFWVYKKKKTLDEEYICKELANLGLDTFYKNVMDTMNSWFSDTPSTEMTEYITARIFSNGTWGTKETHLKAKGVKAGKNAGWKMKLKLIFPSAEKLQYRFPVLQKHKYLLPVMWVARWFDVLLFKRGKIQERMDEVKQVDDDFVDSYKKELEYVGLDFNFKE